MRIAADPDCEFQEHRLVCQKSALSHTHPAIAYPLALAELRKHDENNDNKKKGDYKKTGNNNEKKKKKNRKREQS